MKEHIKPILFLMIGTVFYTELLTSNVHISQLLNPIIPIFLVTIGYGIPVLLIRELLVRWRGGFLSLFFFGLSYGIWNEGIIAKTLLLNTSVPIDVFNGYAGLLGMNFAWASLIVPWHALLSVSFPILITQFFFKNHAENAWLSNKLFNILTILTIMPGVLIFFSTDEIMRRASGTGMQFILLVCCMALFFFLGKIFANKSVIQGRPLAKIKKPLLLGALYITGVLFVPSMLAKSNITAPIIYLTAIILLCIYFILIKRQSNFGHAFLVFVSFGAYVTQGILTILVVPIPEVIITELVLIVIILKGIQIAKKKILKYFHIKRAM